MQAHLPQGRWACLFYFRGVLLVTGSLKRFKPGVDKQVHLQLSAFLWTAVGLLLFFRGGMWLLTVGELWIILPAMLLGSGKSLLFLDKTARKGIHRILRFGDNTCLGAVYSIKTWFLVMAMMGAGFFLRQSSLSRTVLGLMYVAIGWALVLSSRLAWKAWLKENSGR